MGRRKSVRELERELQYARARAAYTPPARETGAVTQRRPKTPVKYNCMLAERSFTVQASAAGLTFFGGVAALGLAQASTDPTAPRGFRPNTIHAMQADATPNLVRAAGSNRPYIRYARGARGSNVQSTFSAPISGTTPVLPAEIKTTFETVSNGKKTEVGAYGRIWMEWERLPVAESGA